MLKWPGMWRLPEENGVSDEDYILYMYNRIHPARAGYQLWWTPLFRDALKEILC